MGVGVCVRVCACEREEREMKEGRENLHFCRFLQFECICHLSLYTHNVMYILLSYQTVPLSIHIHICNAVRVQLVPWQHQQRQGRRDAW